MKKLYVKIRRWVAELLLVFIGVYAAFWLNNFQQHQEQSRQRDQILASLEQELETGIANTKTQITQAQREVREFQQALQDGNRPPLHLHD